MIDMDDFYEAVVESIFNQDLEVLKKLNPDTATLNEILFDPEVHVDASFLKQLLRLGFDLAYERIFCEKSFNFEEEWEVVSTNLEFFKNRPKYHEMLFEETVRLLK